MTKPLYKCCAKGCTETNETTETGLYLQVGREVNGLMRNIGNFYICTRHWLELTQGEAPADSGRAEDEPGEG